MDAAPGLAAQPGLLDGDHEDVVLAHDGDDRWHERVPLLPFTRIREPLVDLANDVDVDARREIRGRPQGSSVGERVGRILAVEDRADSEAQVVGPSKADP